MLIFKSLFSYLEMCVQNMTKLLSPVTSISQMFSWSDSACSGRGCLDGLFCDTIDNYFMTQICLVPTRQNNILDLVITTVPDLVSVVEVCDASSFNMSSDHRFILFNVDIPSCKTDDVKRKVYDYGKADFSGLKGALTSLNLTFWISDSNAEIDEDWSKWKDSFLAAVDDYIPSKIVKSRRTTPWITHSILHLIRKKTSARKKFLQKGSAYFRQNSGNFGLWSNKQLKLVVNPSTPLLALYYNKIQSDFGLCLRLTLGQEVRYQNLLQCLIQLRSQESVPLLRKRLLKCSTGISIHVIHNHRETTWREYGHNQSSTFHPLNLKKTKS